MDFLILSLPRSGSAWLSNFLTYEDVFCFHEIALESNLVRTAPICGAVDTMLYLSNLTAPKMFVLRRNYVDIRHSLRKLTPHVFDDDIGRFEARTKNLTAIHYELLFNIDYLATVWSYFSLMPFNSARAKQLIEMNVQRDFEALVKRAGEYVKKLP